MYHDFYQLSALPFENTPDPRFFYASEQHREALASIEYTIRMRKGFVLITGEVGSGKTTVGRTMMKNCGDFALILQLLHGHGDGGSLIRQVLRLMELPRCRSDDHARMLERLRDRLAEQLRRDKPVVLLVDEAQNLPDEALEELRLLSNFDTATDKLVQVALVGAPELRRRLSQPRYAALRQRIVVSRQLQPMCLEDTTGYIQHRLRAASRDPERIAVTFEPSAIAVIHGFSEGVPRLINVVCDNCLLLGFARQTRQITSAMVRRTLDDMVPSFVELPPEAVSIAPAGQFRPALSLTGS